MDKKDKELLLRDLSGRLPYKPFVRLGKKEVCVLTGIDGDKVYLNIDTDSFDIESIKPILRPMSTMTKEERKEMGDILNNCGLSPYGEIKASGEDNMLRCTAKQSFLFLNYMYSKHFDVNHLIDEGLAYEMPEEMYK